MIARPCPGGKLLYLKWYNNIPIIVDTGTILYHHTNMKPIKQEQLWQINDLLEDGVTALVCGICGDIGCYDDFLKCSDCWDIFCRKCVSEQFCRNCARKHELNWEPEQERPS